MGIGKSLTFSTLIALLLVNSTFTDAADIWVIQGIAVKEAFLELAPQFEKETGHKITTTWVAFADIPKRLMAGEQFDVVISAARMIDDLTKENKIIAGSRVDLASSGIGVAVKSGWTKPDISTADAFKRTVLAAKSIAYSSGASGVYLIDLFQRMGIAEQIKAKSKQIPSATPIGAVVASGEAEIGFQQVSELIAFPGVDLVGPLPTEIQRYTVFSAAIPASSRQPDAAKALMSYLTSAAANRAYKTMGMEPGSR
jgi:molybdate transport system substrate-binding protein